MPGGPETRGENPTPGGAPIDAREALAHQLYFERRDWRAALALWSACEAATGSTLDSRLAITHCLIELADPARLSSIVLADLPTSTRGWVEAYAHVLRARAFQCLSAGDAARASQLTRLLATIEPQLGRVYREAMSSIDRGPRLESPGAGRRRFPIAVRTRAAARRYDDGRPARGTPRAACPVRDPWRA
ncbi:MAG: hypothetical protein WDO24_13180 [Pseudomonadota bacterium]